MCVGVGCGVIIHVVYGATRVGCNGAGCCWLPPCTAVESSRFREQTQEYRSNGGLPATYLLMPLFRLALQLQGFARVTPHTCRYVAFVSVLLLLRCCVRIALPGGIRLSTLTDHG